MIVEESGVITGQTVANDPAAAFPPLSQPSGVPDLGTINLKGTATLELQPGEYTVIKITVDDDASITVAGDASNPTILYVKDNLEIKGSGKLNVGGDPAALIIILTGTKAAKFNEDAMASAAVYQPQKEVIVDRNARVTGSLVGSRVEIKAYGELTQQRVSCECVTDSDCDDADACNGAETCVANACQAGTAPNCDDSNECTADSCDAALGCQNDPVTAGTGCAGGMCDGAGACVECLADGDCDDADACNGAETCVANACQAGTAPDCDDANECTADSCDAALGCQNDPVTAGTGCAGGMCDGAGACVECLADGDCDDADACNGTETCVANACQSGTAPDCDDSNECTADSCDVALGCQNDPVTAGTGCTGGLCDGAGACVECLADGDCDDADVCTGTETCVGNACQAGTALDCDDTNECTADSCDAALGCQNDPVTAGTGCTGGLCDGAGACVECLADGDCDDADACNGLETCVGNVCQPGTTPNCDDTNECTADSCDAVLGCQNSPLAQGTTCTGGECDGSGNCVPTTFECVPGATGPGVLDVPYVDIGVTHQIADLAGITCITGDLYVNDTGLTDLTGLETLQMVGGYVYIDVNSSLTSLDGLENLESVGGSLGISGNPLLTSLAPLAALSSVGYELYVFDNQSLPQCEADWLASQVGIPCTGCTGNNGTGGCE